MQIFFKLFTFGKFQKHFSLARASKLQPGCAAAASCAVIDDPACQHLTL